MTSHYKLYYKYYMNKINLIIANPLYDKYKTHNRTLKLFKEQYPCVFVMPFVLYSHVKKNDMPDCCILLNNDVFGDDCASMSNKCIIGYNVKKYKNIYVDIVEKYVKYFSDSIENHFADKKNRAIFETWE